MPTINPEDLEAIIELDDSQIRVAVQALALDVLAGLTKMFKQGNPSVKLQVGKALLPHLVRSLQHDTESEEIATLKLQMASMQDAILGTSATKLRVVNGEVITEDAPTK